MTYLEAALTILKQAGEPLHYQEIAERALAQKLIRPSGLTPNATMGSRLYTDIKQDESRFIKTGRGTFGLANWQPSGIDAQVKKINQATRHELRERLSTMPPERFEALIGELLIQMGFDESTVDVTKRSGDGGIDVVGVYRAAGLTEVNAAVQIKRWKHNVQGPTVTQLRGSLEVHQQGIIVTSSDFSKGARNEAQAPNKTRIGLINGKELLDLLVKHRVGVSEANLQVISLDDEWWGELLGGDMAPVEPVIAPPADTQSESIKAKTAKPTGMILLSETYPANSWRSVLIITCNVLAQLHGQEFAEKATTLKGRKRQYIAPAPDRMISPTQIPGIDLWVETNLSAKAVQQLVWRLLEILEHDRSTFQILT